MATVELATAIPADPSEHTRAVAAMLDMMYGNRPWRRHMAPVDELVATILSQHTSDINTERAFASLRGRFGAWELATDAPVEAIADAIRGGGLANQKAPRIKAVLAAIRLRFGSFDLSELGKLSVAEARRELTALHGVGPKTASCVLLFGLGMPALPVDTHVHRVTRRLGLIDDRLTADAAHEALESQLDGDRDRVYAFHMHLIHHGRTMCTARRPYCERCSLIGFCRYARNDFVASA